MSRELHAEEVKLDMLRRNNDDGSQRTKIFLQESEVWRKRSELQEKEKELKKIELREDATWNDVMVSKQPKRAKTRRNAIESIDLVLVRFDMWIARLHRKHKIKLKAASALSKTWKVQLEEIKQKAVLTLQRAYRARKAARIAKAQADEIMEIKRAERKRRRKEATDLNAKIRDRADRQAAKHKRRLTEKARREQEEKEAVDARNQSRVKKHQEKETAKRVAKYNRKRKERSIHLWKVYVRVRVQKRKAYGRMMKDRMSRWHRYAVLNRENRLFRNNCARTVQSAFRAYLAKIILKTAKRKKAENEARVARSLARIKNRALFAAFAKWAEHWAKMKKVRGLVARGLYKAMATSFDSWKEYLYACRREKEMAATRMQSLFRGKKGRTKFHSRQQKKKAAGTIQRFWRTTLAKDILARAKRQKEEQERKVAKSLARIKNRHLAMSFDKWHDYATTMRKVRAMVKSGLFRLQHAVLASLGKYVAHMKKRRHECAIMLQAKWRMKKERGSYLYRMKLQRAAIIVQAKWRGHKQHYVLAWLKFYRNGATRIQCWWRARKASYIYSLLRMENILDSAEAKQYLSLLRAFRRGEGFVVDKDGNSALHKAATVGSKRIIKLCLRNGHDINARNNDGETALHIIAGASYLGQEVLADYLITKGAKVGLQNNNGETPLLVAAQLGHDECVDIFIDCNADLAAVDFNGYAALHMAVAYNRVETVKILLQKGADANAKDNEGITSLHDAAGKGLYNVIYELVQYMEDLDVQDGSGCRSFCFLSGKCRSADSLLTHFHTHYSLTQSLAYLSSCRHRASLRHRQQRDRVRGAAHPEWVGSQRARQRVPLPPTLRRGQQQRRGHRAAV